MIHKEKIKLDVFQNSLVKGDVLIDSDDNLYKFIQFGYCNWIDKCKQCKGKMEIQQANGFKDYRCFAISMREGQHWSTLWPTDNKWFNDKDFEI